MPPDVGVGVLERADAAVQRGSVMDLPVRPGDPLTPNRGATPAAVGGCPAGRAGPAPGRGRAPRAQPKEEEGVNHEK